MEALKHMFHEQVIVAIASSIKNNCSTFNEEAFVNDVLDDQWKNRELKDRIAHIAHCIHAFIPLDFPKAVNIIKKASTELPVGYEQMPFPAFIEHYGVTHFDESINAMEVITRGSTCEFAIRPFLKEQPTKTLKVMAKWATHENEHVRRLASEGCRPRLPWGGHFQYAIENPKAILSILEALKNDESLYVRKSVANNLNDISKDHPKLVLEVAKCWLDEKGVYHSWILKRGLRTLLKEANPEALALFGYGSSKTIELLDFSLSNSSLRIGQTLGFSFVVKNRSASNQKLRIEYLIAYAKKSASSTKVFQLSEFEMEGGDVRSFSKKQSFADLSTRKHFPGKHSISIRVNGTIKTSLDFELKA